MENEGGKLDITLKEVDLDLEIYQLSYEYAIKIHGISLNLLK
jgi:hypothetical protein